MRKYNGAFAKPILNIIKEIPTKIILTSIPGSLLCLKGTQRRERLPSRLDLLVSQRNGFGIKGTIHGIFFTQPFYIHCCSPLSTYETPPSLSQQTFNAMS